MDLKLTGSHVVVVFVMTIYHAMTVNTSSTVSVQGDEACIIYLRNKNRDEYSILGIQVFITSTKAGINTFRLGWYQSLILFVVKFFTSGHYNIGDGE